MFQTIHYLFFQIQKAFNREPNEISVVNEINISNEIINNEINQNEINQNEINQTKSIKTKSVKTIKSIINPHLNVSIIQHPFAVNNDEF